MASMNSKLEDLQNMEKNRPGKHSQGHTDSGNVQASLTNQAAE